MCDFPAAALRIYLRRLATEAEAIPAEQCGLILLRGTQALMIVQLALAHEETDDCTCWSATTEEGDEVAMQTSGGSYVN